MPEVDVLKISNEDAAFVLGKNGKTSECARPAPELQQMSAHTARLACERADTPAHSCVLRAFPSPPVCRAEEKIARVSGAELDLFEQALTLEIRGTEEQRKKAKKYVECVMAQRVGPVTIEENHEDEDLTVIHVPSSAVGFVTGSGGNFLRQVEEEWGTLMFFADFRGRGDRPEVSAATRPRVCPERIPYKRQRLQHK